MISFVIPFHSSRYCDLLQTLHFLQAREHVEGWELILICQDHCEPPATRFAKTTLLNMGLDSYRKPVMLNAGVAIASRPILVLLDSDRILPENYFLRNAFDMKAGVVITTQKLMRMKETYTNAQIESGEFEAFEDFRSPFNNLGRKNLFSGNTLMWRQDYLECGGFDEKFVGYGCHDTDMTTNVMNHDLKPVFLKEPEYHLAHDRQVTWEGVPTNELTVMMALNANRYCGKWCIDDPFVHKRNQEILENIDQYPVLGPIFADQHRIFRTMI